MRFPAAVERLLWEYDLEALRAEPELPEIVIERVMARGGWEPMRWLLSTCSPERRRLFLEERGRRVLPPRELNFWAFASSVPEDRTAEWVSEARKREAAWRG